MNGSHNSLHLINYKCKWPLSHCFVDNFRDNIIYHVFEKFFIIYCHFYRPQNEVFEGYVFTGVCLSTGESLRLCPGGSPSRWGFRPGGFLSGGISVQGVSVQWGVSVHRALCPGGLCPGGYLSRGLCQGDPPHGNEWVVHILLECIIVWHNHVENPHSQWSETQ